MSTNCLVTRLKGTANNSEIPIFNAIRFFIGDNHSNTAMRFSATSGNTITLRTLDGSAKIATSAENRDGGIFVDTLTIGSDGGDVFFDNPNCFFVIEGKYQLGGFGRWNAIARDLVIDLAELNYAESISTLFVDTSTIKGNIDNLYNLNIERSSTSDVTFSVRNCVFADDADFSKFGNIKSLAANCYFGQSLRGTNLKGSIEKFVANYRKTHEATSGLVQFSFLYPADSLYITFNGARSTGKENHIFNWAANEQDPTKTDITDPYDTTITIDADGNKVSG